MAAVIALAAGLVVGWLAGYVMGCEDLNEHAYLLGKVVTARKYEASRWTLWRVVAVSWHGSLRLRSLEDPSEAFWLRLEKRPTHLGEVVE